MLASEKTMDKIVALCKNRGFVYAGSEIYGGLSNTWDYGPLGVEFKNNVKRAWWKAFVQESPYNVGLDAAILMNPQVWVASGHVGGFSDPLMDCKDCKTRHRADKLIADQTGVDPEGWDFDRMRAFVDEKGVTRLQGFSLRIIGCEGEHASVRRYAGQHEGGRTGKKGDGCAQQYAAPWDMSKGVMHSGVNGVAKRG